MSSAPKGALALTWYSNIEEKPMRTTTMAVAALAFSIAAMLGSVLGHSEEKPTKAGDRRGVRHHEGRSGHQSTDDRLRGHLRAEGERQEVQPARDHRHRLRGFPEEVARREIRGVHILAGGGVRLPSRQFRHSSEE